MNRLTDRPLFFFRRPTNKTIHRFLENQSSSVFSYPEAGASRHLEIPAGYQFLQDKIQLGSGALLFEKAKSILCQGAIDLPWVRFFWSETPLQAGRTVAILVRACGLWALNAGQIVYSIDTQGPCEQFGFAYGTLPQHVEIGEERFLVEWNRTDDSVCYAISSFSRPSSIFYRIANRYLRKLQKRFVVDSLQTMKKRVLEGRS